MTASKSRYVSQISRNTLALILAGGKGSRLHELTHSRAKPALHFGGNFRIIDFPLSNCINSGIRQIGVMTQYKAHSLIRHLIRGWSHLNREVGEFVELLPGSEQNTPNCYEGTADAIYQNIQFIRQHGPGYVLVLAADQIYKMDYGDMLVEHVKSKADMTISCIEVPIDEAAGNFGVMGIDEQNRIVDFHEKPPHPAPLIDKPGFTLASMGNYVFNTEFLIKQLLLDAENPQSEHDFGKDIIPAAIKKSQVHAFRYGGAQPSNRPFWRDIGTLDAFWQANMDLVSLTPQLNIYDDGWPIWTHQKQSPPAKFMYDEAQRCGFSVDSTVAGGCVIAGAKISKSLLFSDVHVDCHSFIEQSVVLPRVNIGRQVKIRKAIIDSDCKIEDGMQIGCDLAQDHARGFRISQGGVVLVTQQMLV